MRVVARVRPLLDREVDSGDDAPLQVGKKEIVVENPTTALPSTFRLDHVLDPNADQGEMFSLIQHQLDEALEGFNTTVFAVRVFVELRLLASCVGGIHTPTRVTMPFVMFLIM